MIDGHVFGRCARAGNGGVSSDCDLYLSRVMESKKRECLSARIHHATMRKMRVRHGDYIQLIPFDQATRWVVRRVDGPDGAGMKINGGSESKRHGTVRFTADRRLLDEIFNGGRRAICARLTEAAGNEFTFICETE